MDQGNALFKQLQYLMKIVRSLLKRMSISEERIQNLENDTKEILKIMSDNNSNNNNNNNNNSNNNKNKNKSRKNSKSTRRSNKSNSRK